MFTVSLNSLVSVMINYRLNDSGSIPGRSRDFFFETTSRWDLKPLSSLLSNWYPDLFRWSVKWTECEDDHSPPSNADDSPLHFSVRLHGVVVTNKSINKRRL